MLKSMFTLFIALGIICHTDFAEAKTLIVTHPERQFDIAAAAGPAARHLLTNPAFDRKILVLTPLAKDLGVTFSLAGLTYDLVRSPDGVFPWREDDQEITMAGGYAGACLLGSLLSVVQASHANLRITLPMKAIYNSQLSYIYGSADPDLTKTVSDWRAHFDAKIFEDFLIDYGNHLFERIPYLHGSNKVSGRQASEYKISIKLNGQDVASFGEGAQLIQIDFSEKLDL